KKKKNKGMTSVKEECPEVHIRACSCSLPNDRIESAKERKLAMLIQATVMINAKQSGIGERQRGKLMDGNNTRHTNCTLPCMPFVSRKEKVRDYVPLCHCSIS
ncbi:hypothetical protein EMCRGX_G017503, partial [Ephydatia muelleri]